MISKFENLGKEGLQQLADESTSFADMFDKLGLAKSGNGSYKILKRVLVKFNIDLSKLKANKKQYLANLNAGKRIDEKQIFCLNSKVSTHALRDRAKEKLEYRCAECQITSWNNKDLSLQLDHINGIRNDNRVENLRWLCPNCHSQTETWGTKRLKGSGKTWQCIRCEKRISKGSRFCASCFSRKKIIVPL